MERYSLEVRKSVEKDLKAIPVPDRVRILQRIQTLADDPRPPGSKKLSGQERYRLRQGNFRILYEIEDQKLIIVVVKVGNRRDISK